LRKALNRGRMIDPIRTVRGSGYSLDERFLKLRQSTEDQRPRMEDAGP
jgi:DNA-binding winged helix-turn-helix (wHTH) protein